MNRRGRLKMIGKGFSLAVLASAAAVLSVRAQMPQPGAAPKSATASNTAATAAGVRANAQAPSQEGRTLVSAFPAPVSFPKQNENVVQNHFNKARVIAGQDL